VEFDTGTWFCDFSAAQNSMTGFLQKMRLWSTNSSYQRKKIWMGVSPSWLPWLLRRVAPNPRIARSEFVNSYQQQPVCCLVFFLYPESISGFDAVHTVPNSGFVHTLPTEQASSAQQILFCGVMTPTLLPVRSGLECVIVIVIALAESELEGLVTPLRQHNHLLSGHLFVGPMSSSQLTERSNRHNRYVLRRDTKMHTCRSRFAGEVAVALGAFGLEFSKCSCACRETI